MQNTLVWDIIDSLSKPELREFGQILASPFFNQRKDLQLLYQPLKQAAWHKEPLPSKTELFQLVFSNAEYDDQQLRLLLSYLFKLLEKYLVWTEMQSDGLGKQPFLLAAYRKRGLPAHFQKTWKRSKKLLINQPFRNSELYLEKYFMEHEKYLFLIGSERTKELNLQEVEDNLSAAMLSMKLRQACFLRTHEIVFNTQYEIALDQEILAEASKEKFRNIPAIALYRTCYLALFKQEEGLGFKEFKDLLVTHVALFPKAEMRALYIMAINFCIKMVNENDRRFYKEALDLYKSGLLSGLLIEEGYLSRFAYNNIVGIAVRMKEEWKWAEGFVSEYKDYLEGTYQEAAFSLNSARLAFAQKKYDEALIFLQKVDYKDLINNMVAKTMQMKIFFEKQEFELLDSHLRTMRMFIRRNKKMSYHRENWSNIVRYTQKLMELKPFDESRKKALKEQIEKEEKLTEKAWLLEQVGF